MKSIGLFFTLLYIQLQVSASLLSDFRAAMGNVERGFGKLITDVVEDVKYTFHNSLSAVEHVFLSNERLKNTNHRFDDEISPRHISMELKPVANVDEEIDDTLHYRRINNDLKQVTETLKEETNRLKEITEILKGELENMSSNVGFDILKSNFQKEDYSVDSVWDKIKTLHNIQENSENFAEVSKVRKILDKVVEKLHSNGEIHQDSGKYNLDDIKTKLHKYSNVNDPGLQEDKQPILPKLEDLKLNKPNTEIMPKTFKNVVQSIFKQDKVPSDSSKIEKSLFESDLVSLDYLTPFSKIGNKEALNDAKKIFGDSLHTTQVLNSFFNEHRNGPDVFSNQELFNFDKS